MPTNVVMPQMGESIAEGTIVRWIKKVGDNVDRDEPLFEISTDKVDAEIPSPAAGVVSEIRVQEGETVPVNSVVAVIGPASVGASAPTASAARPGETPKTLIDSVQEPPKPSLQADGSRTSPARPEPVEGRAAAGPAQAGHHEERSKAGHDDQKPAGGTSTGTSRSSRSRPTRWTRRSRLPGPAC